MKRLFLFILCIIMMLMLNGCKNKTLYTTCINDIGNHTKVNIYTWKLSHDGKKIIKKDWWHTYKYDTLSEAIEAEEKHNKECDKTEYECSTTRNKNSVTFHISYQCPNNSLNDNDCDYINEIKELEELKFKCEEDTKD